jgi:N-acetylglutamate synthase-like GNAT family acetyltransferase
MTTSSIAIKRIATGTAEYEQMLELRDRVLRIPLGLSVRNDNLRQDEHDVLLVAHQVSAIIGCVILHPVDKETVRLRAMAVVPALQGQGIGRLLVHEAERVAREEGFPRIILHARIVVAGFYEKLGYLRQGEIFTEVTIPHVVMQKSLA